jgi:hypothetical protein
MRKISLLIIALASLSHSQVKTLERKYVPLLFRGNQIPYYNLIIAEWKAFSYDRGQNQWKQVAFQVDEVCAEHGKYNHDNEKDGVLDDNDEWLVMPEDLGDRATDDQWLQQSQSRDQPRVELTFSDPQQPGQIGWLYLYRHVQSDQHMTGYHSYRAAPSNTAADTASTLSYRLGHNRDGWIDFVSFAAAPQTDLVDRLKLRFAGETAIANLGKYVCSEDTLNSGSSTYHPGLVRAFHDQRSLFSIPKLWSGAINADYQWEYYPYSFRIGASGIEVNKLFLAMAGLKSLRQSLDLSERAQGGKFYSAANPEGVVIDGQPEMIAHSVSPSDDAQWLMASGSWGTIVMILNLPQIVNATTQVYYRDDQSGGTGDNSPDTGDLHSFGDIGLWVYTNKVLATDRINIDFTCYLINEPDHTAAFGQQLFEWNQRAAVVDYQLQSYAVSRVERPDLPPADYFLQPGYPNPFNPQQTTWQVLLHSASQDRDISLTVYNLLGKKIAALTPIAAGQQATRFSWDGRDAAGNRLPAGIYFARIRAGGRVSLQRIVLTWQG